VAELDAGTPGPAGVSVLSVGPATLLVDTAVPTSYLGVRIEADDDVAAFRALARLGVHVPPRGLDEAWETPARPSTALLDPTALPAVVLAAILAVDDLHDAARAVASVEMALTAIDAAYLWPGLDEVAQRALWGLVSDPATPSAISRLERRGRIDTLTALLDGVVGRTGDTDLDVALRALRPDDRRDRPGWGDPSRGGRPGRRPRDPRPDDAGVAGGPSPSPAAPAGPVPAGRGRRTRSGLAAPAAFDVTAADALVDDGDEPHVERVGDEVRVTPPPGTRPSAWVRVGRRDGRVLLAAAPVSAVVDGVLRLPVPAALRTDELIVDVVDDPAVAVRSETAGLVERAVRAGRHAVAVTRGQGWAPARDEWGECADLWDAAGDHLRAEQAAANATKPPMSRPFAHDRL